MLDLIDEIGDEPEVVQPAEGEEEATPGQVEAGSEEDKVMNQFFQEVEQIQAAITTIRRNVRSIQQLSNDLVVGTVGEDASEKKTAEMNSLLSETKGIVERTQKRLEKMAESNKADEEDPKKRVKAELRIRKNMHGTLVSKFSDVTRQFADVQTDYQQSMKDRMARQCKVVNPDLTAEEIDEIVEAGSSAVFQDAILEHDLRDKATEALAYVEKKHNDIVKLGQSIEELHQLFLDLATLVAANGELINQIEDNCQLAAEYTAQGLESINKTAVIQKKSRKKLCAIIWIAAIAIIVIVIVCVIFLGF